MELIRDVLDKQLMDRKGLPMGKVDGLVLELSGDGPPRVACVEVGALTQARRLHPRLERWVARLMKRWDVRSDEAFRIPWSKIVVTGNDVTVNVEAEETPAFALELWLRKKLIGRIPGA